MAGPADDRNLERGKRFTWTKGPPGLYRVWDGEKQHTVKDCETEEEAQELVRMLNGRDARGEC